MLELAIVLFVVGLVFIALEMFVPGGIVGTIGFISCVAAIYFAFRVDVWAGAGGIVIVVLLTPTMIYFGLKRASLKTTLDKGNGAVSPPSELALLLGKKGVARSALRPAGMATIDGERVNVVTRGDLISQGTPVRVIEVEGTRVVVKAVEEKDRP